MTIETTVNKHRGALLIAIGGFLIFLYIRHKRQQAAAAAAAQAAAAAAAQDPGTMDQNTYSKQFSQPAPAYLGSPFSGYGANAPNYPPPTQLQPGNGPASPTPPITFPNPAASSGDSTVAAATGGGAPVSLPPIPSYLQVATPDRPNIQLTQDEAQKYLGIDPSVYQSLQVPISAEVANTAISPGTAFSGAGQFVDSPFGPSWQWSS